MVSWLIESQFRGDLYSGTAISGALFMSGGSHGCYSTPPNATGACANCDPTCGNDRYHDEGAMHLDPQTGAVPRRRHHQEVQDGRCPISTTAPGCSSCGGGGGNDTIQPCCGACGRGLAEPSIHDLQTRLAFTPSKIGPYVDLHGAMRRTLQ
eukprot:m.99583 g.99583  ORF g.99583 m.99583 type:complete len:152 (+) comp20634_c0_seq1:507-962(+)